MSQRAMRKKIQAYRKEQAFQNVALESMQLRTFTSQCLVVMHHMHKMLGGKLENEGMEEIYQACKAGKIYDEQKEVTNDSEAIKG